MGLFLTFVYFVGGWGSPDIVVGPGQGHTLYLLGFAVVAAYVPLHLWRRMTDRRDGVAPLGSTAHRGGVARRRRLRRR